MKNGKLPQSQKPLKQLLTADDVFGEGGMNLPEDVKKDMEAKGLTPRWLNAQEVFKNQGYHKKGWKVYRRPAGSKTDFHFGTDPEGVVRRGDSILGYKTEADLAKHQEYLSQRRELAAGKKANAANELRETARKAGLKTFVQEGDEDSE